MRFRKNDIKFYLDNAQEYANKYSTCSKVAVGCAIVPAHGVAIYGANRSMDYDCKKSGCQRIALYGENSKEHRLPADCRAVHSEVDAIASAARLGYALQYATAFVTRYPCEACARALVDAGIAEVYYGRKVDISEQTEQIFSYNGVAVHHVSSWDYDDTEV